MSSGFLAEQSSKPIQFQTYSGLIISWCVIVMLRNKTSNLKICIVSIKSKLFTKPPKLFKINLQLLITIEAITDE